MIDSPRLSRPSLLCYGILALPLAFAGMPLYIYAPDFYAVQFELSLASLGLILLAIRAFDAIQDPVIGMISDRFVAKRFVIIGIGILILGISFYMLFHPNENMILAWFTISMVLATTAFSIISINLYSLGAVLTDEKHERTRIVSYREAIGIIGLILASVLPTVLQQYYDSVEAFELLSMIFITILAVSGAIFLKGAPSKIAVIGTKAKERFFRSFSKAHLRFFTIYGISLLASAIPAVLVLFFIRDRLGAEEYTGLFMLMYFGAGIAGMPLWQKLSKKYGKLEAWIASMVIAVLAFVWVLLLSEGDLWQYGVICLASGLALGAELTLPSSILGDMLPSEQNASGQFSIMTFLFKTTLAIASGTTLVLLDIAGYQPAQENTTQALAWLSIAYALIPCILKLISSLLLWRWIQTHKKEGDSNVSLTHDNRSHHNA
ncbi:MAG: MFS transporter [Rickettsiales bacterium]|nr:MFS transporter [Rickettsiales bacterium]